MTFLTMLLGGCSFVASPEGEIPTSKVSLKGFVDDADISAYVAEPVSGASVYLYRVKNGSPTLVRETTTDNAGQFSFSGITSGIQRAGARRDYYYEIEVVTDDRRLLAATALDDSADVLVDRKSTVFAHSLRHILGDIKSSEAALPGKEVFALLEKLTREDLYRLQSKYTKISSSLNVTPGISVFARGLLSGGEASEQVATRFRFESRWFGLKKSDAGTASWKVYLRDVARASCGAMDGYIPLPIKIAEILSRAVKAGKRFSVAEVIDAFNNTNGNMMDITLEEGLENYRQALQAIEDVEMRSGNSALRFERREVLFLNTLRDLSTEGLSLETRLHPDQALMLWYLLESEGITMRMCKPQTNMLSEALFELTGDSELREPFVAEAQIYHVFGDECHDLHKAAFHAKVYVNMPAVSDDTRLHSLRVVTSDKSSLKTDWHGSAYLFLKDADNDDMYAPELDDACVHPDLMVDYEVQARLFEVNNKERDLAAKKENLNTAHWTMPRFVADYRGEKLSKTYSYPSAVREQRPLIHLPDPELIKDQLENVPKGARVKYSYRFYHEYSRNPGQPLEACGQREETLFTSADTILVPENCERRICASRAGIQQVATQCHVEINAWLLDKEQRILSRSPTTHAYFCVDENGDGRCE